MEKSYFDVKDVGRGLMTDSIGARSINLMSAILDGITYNRLYDEVLHRRRGNDASLTLLEQIIENVDGLPCDLQVGATTDDHIVIERLAGRNGVFIQIRDLLEYADYPNIKLKHIFYEDIHGGIDTKNEIIMQVIVSLLDGVHHPDGNGEDQMYHFCVPFLTIQKNRIPADIPNSRRPPKSKPDKRAFDDFLKDLGDLEMKQLYNGYHVNYDERRNAAKRALDRCILKEHGRQHRPQWRGPGPFAADGNNMHCGGVGTGCVSCGDPGHPDHWCNDYEENNTMYCSLGSEYHI